MNGLQRFIRALSDGTEDERALGPASEQALKILREERRIEAAKLIRKYRDEAAARNAKEMAELPVATDDDDDDFSPEDPSIFSI